MVPDAIYGEPLAGATVVEVPGDLAELFAQAHLRVTGRPAGAHGNGVETAVVQAAPAVGASVDDVVAALEAARQPIVLAGPGVVRDGAVEGLRALAAAGSLGVLNTWGAKGVFDWQSPHHLATAGLQARDFELGGLADADLIVATGVDEAEALAGWRLAPALEVRPADLSAVAERWHRPAAAIPVPPLRTELARVTQEGWVAEAAPLPPGRVTLAYREALGPDGLVVADPGVAGYWVARTFPTSGVGGAVVPAEADRPGLAAACAVVARLVDPTRRVLLVLDAADPATDRVLDAGRSHGIEVAVELWKPDGEALGGSEHRQRLDELLAGGRVGRGAATLATDASQLAAMVDVAGPVVAWGGLPAAEVPPRGAIGEAG